MTLLFDGRPVPCEPGQTVAAALWAAGIRSWRTTAGSGAPRGLFCGIGACYDCLLTIDGRPTSAPAWPTPAPAPWSPPALDLGCSGGPWAPGTSKIRRVEV